MPLKLIEPDPKRGPNYRIRGTYLGVSVDRSARTSSKKVAGKVLKKLKEQIECGTFAQPGAATFASATRDYLIADGEARFTEELLLHFGNMPLEAIDQAAINAAAIALLPDATPATRNRQVYTPVSAILKSAGKKDKLERPKGSRGKKRTFFLQVEQLQRLISSAYETDEEFGIFCHVLYATGCRLSEGLSICPEAMNLSEGWAWVAETKNGEARMAHLPAQAVAAIASHPRGVGRPGRLFRFTKCGRLYGLLKQAIGRSGVPIPERVKFHVFRHTFGAHMRRYGGLDTAGLVATKVWRDPQSAAVYEHVIQSEEARKADLLPVVGPVQDPCRARELKIGALK